MTGQLTLAHQIKARVPRLIRHGYGYPRPNIVRVSASSAPAFSFGTEDKTLSLVHVPARKDNFAISTYGWKSLEVHHEPTEGIRYPAPCPCGGGSDPPDFSFNKPPPSYLESSKLKRHTSSRFTAREAQIDEEFRAAAILRALAHYDDTLGNETSGMRRVAESRMLYADREFKAIKQRRSTKEGNSLQCFCLIAVKNFLNRPVRRTALNTIVGTLDLSYRHYLEGEKYPGVYATSGVLASEEPDKGHMYGYISNLVVSKAIRRRGIALHMMYLAIDMASYAGIKKLFVHVRTNQKAAQRLFKKVGFKIVEDYSSDEDQSVRLMSLEL